MKKWIEGGRGMEWETNERDIVRHYGIRENLVLGKFPELTRMTADKTPINSREGAWTALLL